MKSNALLTLLALSLTFSAHAAQPVLEDHFQAPPSSGSSVRVSDFMLECAETLIEFESKFAAVTINKITLMSVEEKKDSSVAIRPDRVPVPDDDPSLPATKKILVFDLPSSQSRSARTPEKTSVALLRNGILNFRVKYNTVPLADGAQGITLLVDLRNQAMLTHVYASKFNLEAMVDLFATAYLDEVEVGVITSKKGEGFVAGPVEGKIVEKSGRKQIEIVLRLEDHANPDLEGIRLLSRLRILGK